MPQTYARKWSTMWAGSATSRKEEWHIFILYVDKSKLMVRQREPVTSGSANVCTVRFEFSPDWDGLIRVAVFKAGAESRPVLLDKSGECAIPWEVLEKPGVPLLAGVYGVRGGGVVLPTVWANLGTILEGVPHGKPGRPPTPELWEQELAGKGEGLSYDGQNLSLMAGDKALSTVQITGCEEKEFPYTFGHGLKVSGTTVAVDAVNGFDGDNTLPITASAVETVVGNIEILLNTI